MMSGSNEQIYSLEVKFRSLCLEFINVGLVYLDSEEDDTFALSPKNLRMLGHFF